MEETWRQAVGFAGYDVSDHGRVRNRATMKVLKRLTNHRTGYSHQCITNRIGKVETVYVARLVAEAFLPNPEGKKCVRFRDGDKQNITPGNLEWVTYAENAKLSPSCHCYTRPSFRMVNTVVRKTWDGKVIEIFPSVKAAAEALNEPLSVITKRCNSKERREGMLAIHFDKIKGRFSLVNSQGKYLLRDVRRYQLVEFGVPATCIRTNLPNKIFYSDRLEYGEKVRQEII
jgi:hypothetical protein